MGTAQSREDYISDSDEYNEEEDEDQEEEEQNLQKPSQYSETAIDDVDAKLRALKLKYGSPSHSPSPSESKIRNSEPAERNAVKLYLHIGGNTPKAKWIVSEKSTTYEFVKTSESDSDSEESESENSGGGTSWFLRVGSKVRCRVSTDMQIKMIADQRRVDFVCRGGVWAAKFPGDDRYRRFITEFQDRLFENVYGFPATEENKVKVYGKEFMGWVKPEFADETMWEAEPDPAGSVQEGAEDLVSEFEEAASSGVHSLTLGALANSFLVSDTGVEVYRNMRHGIQGKGVSVKFARTPSGRSPGKALLMRAETSMMLMSPLEEGRPHSAGLHQLDVESGKSVSEWKFEKDGTAIAMRDIAGDSKASQLDPSGSTFLGLDDNRLCQWDTRAKEGLVGPVVLHWTKGHQFSRGTNFRCLATAGDGSVAVGSVDGKIRLYAKDSAMRQAKTAFPGLGSPVTHIDVTFDGKWVLGTTDTYLVLICTLFTDKDGRTKTGFGARMGNKIPAPRLLKLTPLDSHLAGADNKFHGGHFSWVTENGKQERHIVATVGKFSVIWDFRLVKNSAHGCYRNQQGLKSCYCYKIVLKDESIVESRFMHDNFASTGEDSPEAPLVVTTPMKVSSISLSGRRTR